MSSKGFLRAAVLALAAAAAPLLGGCDDSSTAPAAAPALEVLPTGPVRLQVGDTLRLQTSLRNGTGAVAFFSSDAAVASVSGEGTVRALREGTATVTARSVAQPSVTASVRVDVVTGPAPIRGGVTIETLLTPTGSNVDASAASGQVFVRLAVNQPGAARVQVLVDSVVACAEPIPAGSPQALRLVCPIDTARHDSVTGAPTFRNGAHTLRARVLSAGDSTLASAEGAIVLANAARLVAVVDAERSARDAEGDEWLAGAVRVSVLPVVYDAETAIRVVRARYADRSLAAVDSAAPYLLTFPAEALAGLTDADFELLLTSTTASGEAGPAIDSTAAVRYDSRAPEPGAFASREWVGRDVTFASLYRHPAAEDAGVGGATLRFFAGPAARDPEELVRSGTEVRAGGDLRASDRGAYGVAALLCDRLDNCVTVPGFAFGADPVPPVVLGGGASELLVNPTAPLLLTLNDEGSGFDVRPLEAAVRVLDRDSATSTCGPVVNGLDLPGRLAGSTCLADTVTTEIPVPQGRAGYYRYTIVAFDRAGNRAESVRRDVLVDAQAPTVTTVSIPAQFTGGERAVLAAAVHDNLDLASVSFRFRFPVPAGAGTISIPAGAPVVVGSALDDVLATSLTATDTVTLLRTLTAGAVSGSRTTRLVEAVETRVADAAGLRGIGAATVPPGSLNSTAVADPFARIAAHLLVNSAPLLCIDRCLAGDQTRAVLSVRLTGESGFDNPVERVAVFLRDAAGEVRWIGSTVRSATVDAGALRTVTFEVAYTPDATAAGEYGVFAVGVDGRGNALLMPEVPIRLFRR